MAQLRKTTSFNANGLLGGSDPAAKTVTPCFLVMGIKNGQYVRELPQGSGFDCNAKTFNASGITG